MQGKFIGPVKVLRNKTALILEITGDDMHVLAQFDDLKLSKKYTYSWTKIPKRYFIIEGAENV